MKVPNWWFAQYKGNPIAKINKIEEYEERNTWRLQQRKGMDYSR